MIRQESGFNPNAHSPAGAQGIAQFMPGTAPGYGVNLHDNRVTDDLEGAAKYIAANLKRTGGNYHEALSIYNSGRPQGYLSIPETKNYVRTILANAGNHEPTGRASRSTSASRDSSSRATTRTITTNPGVDNSDARRQALSQFLLSSGADPTTGQQTGGDILSLALQMRALKDVPAQTTTVRSRSAAPRRSSGASARSAPLGHFKAGDPVVGGTSIGGTHPTLGLAGYPAKDYFAPSGARVVAPISGKVVRLSGHDPSHGPTQGPHGPLGWSVYIKGDDGRTYFLTHMGSRNVKPGQTVRAGQPIGTVADYAKYGTPSHIHMGVH